MLPILFASLLALTTVESCPASVTGPLSDTATLQFSLSPPVRWTYNDETSPTRRKREAVDGQSVSLQAAKRAAEEDFKNAINAALKTKNILSGNLDISYDFTPPDLKIEEGGKCSTPGGYVVVDGTVVYQCVAPAGEPTTVATTKTTKTTPPTTPDDEDMTTPDDEDFTTPEDEDQTTPEDEATTDDEGDQTTPDETTTDDDTTATEETTTDDTTDTDGSTDTPGSTTTGESTTTNMGGVDPGESDPVRMEISPIRSKRDVQIQIHPIRRKRAVQTKEFDVNGSVVVKAGQLLFESQWKEIALEVQVELEKKHAQFHSDITVILPK